METNRDKESKVFKEVVCALNAGYRYIVNKGGTRSGKTYSTLQALMMLSMCVKNKTITITSETFPHLRLGCMRDWENILDEFHLRGKFEENKTTHIYTNKDTGTKVEFVSFADKGRAHGSQRDYLFVNECVNVSYEIIDQLKVRTSKTILLDYNPVCSFWCDQQIERRDDCYTIHTTFEDNKHLSEMQRQEILSHKGDGNNNWWRVYGLGLTGFIDNQIFTNWDVVKDIPPCKDEYYGIDWGYTLDPSTLIKVCRLGDDLYINELLYRTGLTNPEIAQEIKHNGITGYDYLVADSAEQKSIDEINRLNHIRILPVRKYPNSIVQGIEILQRFKIHITERSLNVIKEFRNYIWKKDKDGNIIQQPQGGFDHSIDAIRYVAMEFLSDAGTYEYDSDLGDL